MKKILWAGSNKEVAVDRVTASLNDLYTEAEVIARPSEVGRDDIDAILEFARENACDIIAFPYDVAGSIEKLITNHDMEFILEDVTKTSTNRHCYSKAVGRWFVELDISHNGWNKLVGVLNAKETEKSLFVEFEVEPIAR